MKPVLVGLLVVVVQVVVAEPGFESSWGFGPKTQQTIPMGYWFAGDVPPLLGASVTALLPGGVEPFQWSSFTWTGALLGWTLVSGDFAATVVGGATREAKVAFSADQVQGVVQLRGTPILWSSVRWRDVRLFGGTLSGTGSISAGGVDAVGDLAYELWTVGVLYRGFSFGYAEAHSEGQTAPIVSLVTPYRVSESVEARAIWAWAIPQWTRGDWSWGLGIGAGAAWISSASFVQTKQWTELTGTFPFLSWVDHASRNVWELRGCPAWAVVVRPSVGLRLGSGWNLSLSRWLPWTGGWSVAQTSDSSPATTGSGTRGGEIEPWDLWMAGFQLSLGWTW